MDAGASRAAALGQIDVLSNLLRNTHETLEAVRVSLLRSRAFLCVAALVAS